VKGSTLENVDTVGEQRKSAVVLDYCSQVRTNRLLQALRAVNGTSRQPTDDSFRITPTVDSRLDLTQLGRARAHRPGYTVADIP
jgi:hypothetical protein